MIDDFSVHNPLKNQKGGDHYKKLGIHQPWLVKKAWMTPEEFRGAAKSAAIDYLARERDKGGDLDIEKAIHTLQIYLFLKTEQPEDIKIGGTD